ncbi:MAG: alpha/beta hydrolase [PVC group bacterium]
MKIVALIALLILVGSLGWFLVRKFERSRMYYPQRTLEAYPCDLGLAYEDVSLATADGLRLHGWWVPADQNRGTVLFCHGNAGNISHRLESIEIFHRLGLNVFIFDYRGYGLSEGSPSEDGTYRDAEAAYDYLRQARHIPSGRIVIFGRSLGGAVAVELARLREAGALICESTFTSSVDLAHVIFPFLPVRLLIFNKYETIMKVPGLALPKLFIHSRQDELVPFEQGERLFRAAGDPKEFLAIQGSHGEGFLQTGAPYLERIDRFLKQYLKQH